VREALVVERTGRATVQDLGRPGLAHQGISAHGAADAHAARIANTLVGNRAGAPLIEVTGSSFGFRSRRRLLLAVTGAAARLLAGGVPCPLAEPVVVAAGCPVQVEPASSGQWIYLALNGAIAATPVLGSVAPDPVLGIGRTLAEGDALHLSSRFAELDHPFSRVPLFRLAAPRTPLARDLTVDVTPGPDADEFPTWPAGAFTVSPVSDAVGLRLTGPAPRREVSTEILSRGVPVGAVEVPPGGGLLVLLRGRLVTAGYPIVAVATTTALDRLGQVRPGDTLTFRTRDVDSAVAELRERERALTELAARVARAFRSAGLGHVLDDEHLSTSTGAPAGAADSTPTTSGRTAR
jgi:biotin-dependent carboxylase-like uncharacterized protein